MGLVIGRHPGQSFELIVDSQIVITVTIAQCTDGYCRIKIDAPKAVRIMRSELLARGYVLDDLDP